MDPDDPVSPKRREPAWLSKLASLGADAAARQQRDARRRGSSGAAGAGRSVAQWSCGCGWTGPAKELKPDPETFALRCPACGESGLLKAAAS